MYKPVFTVKMVTSFCGYFKNMQQNWLQQTEEAFSLLFFILFYLFFYKIYKIHIF